MYCAYNHENKINNMSQKKIKICKTRIVSAALQHVLVQITLTIDFDIWRRAGNSLFDSRMIKNNPTDFLLGLVFFLLQGEISSTV